MDDNKERFRPDPINPSTAGDDLSRIAREMEQLRDFLIGLIGSLVPVTGDTLHHMACAEEAVQEMFWAKWQDCQDVLEQAADDDLTEADTEWMGKKMPGYFHGMTVETLRGMVAKARQPRKVQTNPSTLISMGGTRCVAPPAS